MGGGQHLPHDWPFEDTTYIFQSPRASSKGLDTHLQRGLHGRFSSPMDNYVGKEPIRVNSLEKGNQSLEGRVKKQLQQALKLKN